MNRTIEKLENLLRTFATNRRSGHTRAMMNGAANTFGVVVIVADLNQRASMQGDYPRQTYITINDARSLIGYKGPVVIDHYAVQVLISEALVEIDKLNKHCIEAGKAASQAKQEAANWEESAAQFLRNQEYYRGLVVKIGETIGEQAYIRDDGSFCEDVLCAKVPEIIAAGKEQGAVVRKERDEWKWKYERLAAALEDYGSKSESQTKELREQLANAEKRVAEAIKQIRIAERRADEASAKDPAGLKLRAAMDCLVRPLQKWRDNLRTDKGCIVVPSDISEILKDFELALDRINALPEPTSVKDIASIKLKVFHDIAVVGLREIQDGRYGLASTHARDLLKRLDDELYKIFIESDRNAPIQSTPTNES